MIVVAGAAVLFAAPWPHHVRPDFFAVFLIIVAIMVLPWVAVAAFVAGIAYLIRTAVRSPLDGHAAKRSGESPPRADRPTKTD